MSTMTRTDIHRPSAPEFDPENYDLFGFADFHERDGHRPVQVVAALVAEGWSFRGAPHGSGQCSHCGTNLRYAALMGHTPTKTLMYIGETCLGNRFEGTKAEFEAMRKEAAAKAERSRKEGKAAEFFDAHPEMVILTYANNIAVAGGVVEWTTAYAYGEVTFATEAEAQAWIETQPNHRGDYPVYGYKRGTTWAEQTRTGKWTDVLSDMGHKVTRYGSLSDAQVEFANKILGWLDEAEARRVAAAEVAAAKIAAGVKVTEGRQVIEGTVTTIKFQDNGYGGVYKMRVVNGDLAYWGSVPASIDGVEKEQRVRFTATVEQSKDDPAFGFYSRPTKAEIIG